MERSLRRDTGFTGADLIEMGFRPGPHFGPLLKDLNATLARCDGMTETETDAALVSVIEAHRSRAEAERLEREARLVPMRSAPVDIVWNIEAESEEEAVNVAAVREAMERLALTPTLVGAAVMPDSCPAGSIPVGGVAGARGAIHPGWHSADICCSMMATNLGKVDPKAVLDAGFAATHFGPGGRPRHAEVPMPKHLLEMLMSGNPFLGDLKLQTQARSHLMTQGDGNHFLTCGRSEATGETWLVTHHGSRGFGAMLYKAGMAVAERFRQEICPELDKGHAWIPFDTKEGQDYWAALQIAREWTRMNHSLLHDRVAGEVRADVVHRRWNEHNFVFRDGDDVFWHAKGATPIHDGFLPDSDGIQILPLNMAHPILFIEGERTDRNLGFAPHGAGRNLSRTQHRRRMEGETDAEIFARETEGLDVRFWCGKTDISELPSAYKNAEKVEAEMARFGLARVVDRIQPFGSIMAGDWEADAPWRRKT